MVNRSQCEWLGCLTRARAADREYREVRHDDRRPIYCDEHSDLAGRGGRPACGCGKRAIDYCFMCRVPICYAHRVTLFDDSLRIKSTVYRCEGCKARSWAVLEFPRQIFRNVRFAERKALTAPPVARGTTLVDVLIALFRGR